MTGTRSYFLFYSLEIAKELSVLFVWYAECMSEYFWRVPTYYIFMIGIFAGSIDNFLVFPN